MIVSLAFLFSSLVSASGLINLDQQIVVRFSHTHIHHHKNSNSKDHKHLHHKDTHSHNSKWTKNINSERATQNSEETHKTQHTHELTMNCCTVLCVPTQLALSVRKPNENQFPPPVDTDSPHSCYLDSLFRPPIQIYHT